MKDIKKSQQVQNKREKEKQIVDLMIHLYCRKKHKTVEKRWIRREFNKTNGMIFLYKILFGQLTFLIMMAMYRLFPVDEHFNDGAVWYLISGFLCLGIFVIWRRPSFFRTQIFPVHSHMSPGKFLSFFGIFMIAQNASSVLYVLMEMGAANPE